MIMITYHLEHLEKENSAVATIIQFPHRNDYALTRRYRKSATADVIVFPRPSRNAEHCSHRTNQWTCYRCVEEGEGLYSREELDAFWASEWQALDPDARGFETPFTEEEIAAVEAEWRLVEASREWPDCEQEFMHVGVDEEDSIPW